MILPIIAKLIILVYYQVSQNLVNSARKFARINGPGCLPRVRPVITRTKTSVVENQQFENFFADRENVTMSSYKVDPKTNLPILVS